MKPNKPSHLVLSGSGRPVFGSRVRVDCSSYGLAGPRSSADDFTRLTTVRMLLVEHPSSLVVGRSITPMTPDEMLCGTDIHGSPREAHDWLLANSDLVSAAALVGVLGWAVPIRAGDQDAPAWVARRADLDSMGSGLYASFSALHPNATPVLVTSEYWSEAGKASVLGELEHAGLARYPRERRK